MDEATVDVLRKLQTPETRDSAAQAIVDRFVHSLLPLIRKNLSGAIRQRVDEQDVLQSVWGSFFRREFDVASGDELAALLASLCVRKSVDVARRHTAARRDVRTEADAPMLLDGTARRPISGEPARIPQGERALSQPAFEEDSWVNANDMLVMLRGATAEQATCARETFESLPDELREVLALRLQGFTETEIAAHFGWTRRTVSRRLSLLRTWMRAEIERTDSEESE